jgi:hypothetical protein
VVAAEVFPQRLRGKGMTLTTLANWLTNFAIAKTVPLVRTLHCIRMHLLSSLC